MEESILLGFGLVYDLDAYVVMPDHVHLLLTPLGPQTLSGALRLLKGSSARRANQMLAREGRFWQDESFDHVIRGEADWLGKRQYIHNNPVVAGLAAGSQGYPMSSAVTLEPPGRRESLRALLGGEPDHGSGVPTTE